MEQLKNLGRKLDEWGRSIAGQLIPSPAPVPVRVGQTGQCPGGRVAYRRGRRV